MPMREQHQVFILCVCAVFRAHSRGVQPLMRLWAPATATKQRESSDHFDRKRQ